MPPVKTRSRDRSSLPHYRVELPILLDDMNLSVYAFRLYVHLKRVAERSDEGSCWESARTLASACNMSSGQVSKAKDELEQQGLITRHPKVLRGGIGDDITIVDIWPRNFERYAPERKVAQESDHHTITSTSEVITTRSLSESDHHTITSSESYHCMIAETIKRSYSDPIDHDQYHIGVSTTPPTPTARESKNGVGGGGGGGENSPTFQFLVNEAISAATEFADLPYDVMRADYDARRKDGQTKAGIVRAWRLKRPTAAYRYTPESTMSPPPQPAPQSGLTPEQLRELKSKHDYTRRS